MGRVSEMTVKVTKYVSGSLDKQWNIFKAVVPARKIIGSYIMFNLNNSVNFSEDLPLVTCCNCMQLLSGPSYNRKLAFYETIACLYLPKLLRVQQQHFGFHSKHHSHRLFFVTFLFVEFFPLHPIFTSRRSQTFFSGFKLPGEM
jgi:hypothetical protein